jgi:hypothetical protein
MEGGQWFVKDFKYVVVPYIAMGGATAGFSRLFWTLAIGKDLTRVICSVRAVRPDSFVGCSFGEVEGHRGVVSGFRSYICISG